MKKKLLAILLCAAVSVSVCACGDTNDIRNAAGEKVGKPSVTEMADYSDFSEVLSGEYKLTEEMIGAYFYEVLYDAGVGVVEVTDRDTVQDGDIVKVDYTGYKDGVAFEGGAATDQWIDVTNNCSVDTANGTSGGSYIEGFTDGLIGAKVGEKTRSAVTFPEEYHSEELAGQPAEFEFTVHAIYTEVTQENITDEFVAENLKKTYEVSTVAEFMKFLEEELAYTFTMNYVIQNSTFDIPEDYVEYRLEGYQAYFEELNCGELAIEEYLAYYGYTLESMQAEWSTALQSQIKSELIFAQIVKEQGLKLDEKGHKEYVDAIIAVNTSYFPDADSIYKYAGAGNVKAGEEYLKNQTAVREYMLDEYRNTAE